MPSRTKLVCLCEGAKGRGIDALFINTSIKALKPAWVRPQGSNFVRPQPCGSRSEVIKRTPKELKDCLSAGSDTTLMVWADCDDDCADGDALKREFWKEAKEGESHSVTSTALCSSSPRTGSRTGFSSSTPDRRTKPRKAQELDMTRRRPMRPRSWRASAKLDEGWRTCRPRSSGRATTGGRSSTA